MDAVLARIVRWAEAENAVRVVVLTSTRARAEGPPDELSDYDVIVTLEDIDRFDAAEAYRTPAARWGDEHDVHGTTAFFRGVVYDDGVKIDWTLWPAEVPGLVAEHGLTDGLDVGYRVLIDKDGTTARWAQPTYRAHIPRRPTEGVPPETSSRRAAALISVSVAARRRSRLSTRKHSLTWAWGRRLE